MYTLLSLLCFALFVLFPIRWGFVKIVRATSDFSMFEDKTEGGPGEFFVWLSLMLCVTSAWVTEFLGVHSIFGAFLAGLCVPRENDMPRRIISKIEDLVNVLFLPLVLAAFLLLTFPVLCLFRIKDKYCDSKFGGGKGGWFDLDSNRNIGLAGCCCCHIRNHIWQNLGCHGRHALHR